MVCVAKQAMPFSELHNQTSRFSRRLQIFSTVIKDSGGMMYSPCLIPHEYLESGFCLTFKSLSIEMYICVCFLLTDLRGGHLLYSKPNQYLKFSKSLMVFYSLKGFSAWRKPGATWLKFSISPLGLELWVTSDLQRLSPLQVWLSLGAVFRTGTGSKASCLNSNCSTAQCFFQLLISKGGGTRCKNGKIPAG